MAPADTANHATDLPLAQAADPAQPGQPGGAALSQQLLTMGSGAWVSQMIIVAAELGVADHLVSGERSVHDLADACSADPEALFRLLRGLASLGIFQETEPRQFALTPLADLLRSDHPQSMRMWAQMMGDEHFLSWDSLLHSVRTGEGAFRHRYGMTVFEWYQRHPERGEIFDGAMGAHSRPQVAALLDAYDFSAISHLVDVGGGSGLLLQSTLRSHPHLRGTLFDQPQVVAPVEVPTELKDRLEVQGGDFFAGVPACGDAYLLKHILHDWGDDACRTILEHIRAVLPPEGRVLIVEQVIPPGNAPFPGKLLDLNMLVMTEGGRERSVDEYTQLLESADLRLNRIVPTASPVSVVEAIARD
jgi:hypothetical protein